MTQTKFLNLVQLIGVQLKRTIELVQVQRLPKVVADVVMVHHPGIRHRVQGTQRQDPSLLVHPLFLEVQALHPQHVEAL